MAVGHLKRSNGKQMNSHFIKGRSVRVALELSVIAENENQPDGQYGKHPLDEILSSFANEVYEVSLKT